MAAMIVLVLPLLVSASQTDTVVTPTITCGVGKFVNSTSNSCVRCPENHFQSAIKHNQTTCTRHVDCPIAVFSNYSKIGQSVASNGACYKVLPNENFASTAFALLERFVSSYNETICDTFCLISIADELMTRGLEPDKA